MITITLPDGSQRQFDKAITIAELAASIGTGLAKAALAGKVDGRLVDLSYPITKDVQVAIVTEKDPEALDVIRHSTAHLCAQAVKQLYPKAQVTIGPVIEDGFYYDFYYPPGFTPEDLKAIEKKMAELAAQNQTVTRSVMPRDEAIKFFRAQGEEYKAKIIEDIPSDEPLSLYSQGDFTDLCRGPHVPNTNKLKVFKLMKLAGAYWRGDAKNEMLQRVYGTAWLNKKDLEDYLFRLEEAEKRDHRKTAKKLDLFHLQEEAPGMIFWHPNGWKIYQTIKRYVQKKLQANGYEEINTPIMADFSLWERSGHADKYAADMFNTESENRRYAIKPMSCPCHVQVFNQGIKSYRDLPIRLAEFGHCHRNESSGSLHGLMRVRGFTQDDAHIFCTEDQIQEEALRFIQLLQSVYRDFGYTDIIMRLSTRPANRLGDEAVWDKAESGLQKALDASGYQWQLNPGDGAFYGPKIDFSLKDSINRVWQCGTLQLDFILPKRLQAEYVAESGERKTPVMLHRAILGSLERFIGILLEHYAEGLPLWLAPIQVAIMNITDQQADYCQELHKELINHGIQSKLDLRNEKIGFKIREHTIARIPYLLVVGDREVENKHVSVRTRTGEDLGTMSLQQFLEKLKEEMSLLNRVK
jgi:threonyl-tRNA synthetase